MITAPAHQSPSQAAFRDLVLGTLIYAVVLGFFNDYTSLLYTSSFSIIFSAAIVLQVLTMLTLLLKDRVVGKIKGRSWRYSTHFTVLVVWAIMFFSKFVFLEVIDIIFGSLVQIQGFGALILIILCMMVAQQLVERIYRGL